MITAEQALARLEEGNARFAAGRARFPTVPQEVLAGFAREQHPYATILGCSDSRVPPELVFDAGVGELFHEGCGAVYDICAGRVRFLA